VERMKDEFKYLTGGQAFATDQTRDAGANRRLRKRSAEKPSGVAVERRRDQQVVQLQELLRDDGVRERGGVGGESRRPSSGPGSGVQPLQSEVQHALGRWAERERFHFGGEDRAAVSRVRRSCLSNARCASCS